MKNMSFTTKAYILGVILISLGLITWTTLKLDWTNPWLHVMALLGAVAQTLKVEGPNNKTNYSLAWFVYGFVFIAMGPAASIFVIVIAHLVEWIWHKYPWFIQSFNIGNHVISVFIAGLVFEVIVHGTQAPDIYGAMGLIASNLIFVAGNHYMVGVVVKLARGQSFAESGVFEFLTLFLDFTMLSMGSVTALVWFNYPFASLLNILPLYLLFNALHVPSLKRQLQELKRN